MQTRSQRNPGRQGGFTLVELMTVVAIVGVAAALGLVYIDSGSKGKKAEAYAQSLGAQYEMARARAVAKQRIQRLVIEPDRYTHWQYEVEGLAEDVGSPFAAAGSWDAVGEFVVPTNVTIASSDSTLHFDANVSVPAVDPALFLDIYVMPDGRARTEGSTDFFEDGWTVFINDSKRDVRTLLFAVTGTSATYDEW